MEFYLIYKNFVCTFKTAIKVVFDPSLLSVKFSGVRLGRALPLMKKTSYLIIIQ